MKEAMNSRLNSQEVRSVFVFMLDIIAEFMPKDNRKKIMRIGTIFARPCKKLETDSPLLSFCALSFFLHPSFHKVQLKDLFILNLQEKLLCLRVFHSKGHLME